MDMKEFLSKYAANLLSALEDHGFGLNSFSWTCDLCPLREQCEKDSEENPGPVTCGEFIQLQITDGKKYRL
jgi:hypothetical protein